MVVAGILTGPQVDSSIMVGMVLARAQHLVHGLHVPVIDRLIARQGACLDAVLLVALVALAARELVRRAVRLAAAAVPPVTSIAPSAEVDALSVRGAVREVQLFVPPVVTRGQPMVPGPLIPTSLSRSAPLIVELHPIALLR